MRLPDNAPHDSFALKSIIARGRDVLPRWQTELLRAPVFVVDIASTTSGIDWLARLPYETVLFEAKVIDGQMFLFCQEKKWADDGQHIMYCTVYGKKAGAFHLGQTGLLVDFRRKEVDHFCTVGGAESSLDAAKNLARAVFACLRSVRDLPTSAVLHALPSSRRPLSARRVPPEGWRYCVVPLPQQPFRSGHSLGGTHASPRWHMRRGHFRHLRSGKEIWIGSCEVGSKERGGVVHDYVVVPADGAVP